VDPLRRLVFAAQHMPPPAAARLSTGVSLFVYTLPLELAVVCVFATLFLAIKGFGRAEEANTSWRGPCTSASPVAAGGTITLDFDFARPQSRRTRTGPKGLPQVEARADTQWVSAFRPVPGSRRHLPRSTDEPDER